MLDCMLVDVTWFLNPFSLAFSLVIIWVYKTRNSCAFLLTDVESLTLDDSEDENALSIFEMSCHSGSPKKSPPAAAVPKPYLHFTMWVS